MKLFGVAMGAVILFLAWNLIRSWAGPTFVCGPMSPERIRNQQPHMLNEYVSRVQTEWNANPTEKTRLRITSDFTDDDRYLFLPLK
jgi:hypothetical protein